MELPQAPIGAQECVLGDVFGFVGIVGEPVGKAHDRLAITIDERLEGNLRTGARRVYEGAITVVDGGKGHG